jgi:hypothetical protein
MKKVKFKETQHYTNRLTLCFLGTIALVAVLKGMLLLSTSKPDITNSLFGFAVAFSTLLLIWWLINLKLKVVVSEKNIKFKLSPIHPKKRSIPWQEIARCEIVETPEAAQWSGGNITFNHEKRYSLTGRNGLSITTKKGKNFFIGCSDLAGLKEAIDSMELQGATNAS